MEGLSHYANSQAVNVKYLCRGCCVSVAVALQINKYPKKAIWKINRETSHYLQYPTQPYS